MADENYLYDALYQIADTVIHLEEIDLKDLYKKDGMT
jgi:hypothetical protein